MGKVCAHLKASECVRMIFLPHAPLLVFYQSINQSFNKVYLSTVVVKAEKLMGPCQKKKEKKYKTTIIIIVQ